MRTFLSIVLALPFIAQAQHMPRGTATDVTSDEVQATLKNGPSTAGYRAK